LTAQQVQPDRVKHRGFFVLHLGAADWRRWAAGKLMTNHRGPIRWNMPASFLLSKTFRHECARRPGSSFSLLRQLNISKVSSKAEKDRTELSKLPCIIICESNAQRNSLPNPEGTGTSRSCFLKSHPKKSTRLRIKIVP
jgi:hypothetical protein